MTENYVIVAVNPYAGKISDEVVKDYYKKYYSQYDGQALDMGLPDKFTCECCSKFLWENGKYTMKKVLIFISVIIHCMVLVIKNSIVF